MKRLIHYSVIFLLATLPIVMHGQNSFVAEMANVKLGTKHIYQVKSDGEKYRYDFDEDGSKGIVIVNPAKNETAILIPEEKYVHYTETSSRFSRSNDPIQSVLTTINSFTEKKMGSEKITGFTCNKSELYMGDKKTYTLWFSEELNFPLKIVNNLGKDTYMELTGIEIQKIDPSVFVVPEDYIEVDNRMRPIIPEPPAPEQWNTIEADLPLSNEYSRGDLIRFKIPETKNYVISLKNNSTDPVKIIRKTFRDGKELPDNEQGPIKYRTRRLFANETSRDTYSWKAGDAKILEVYEGKLTVEIQEER